MNNFKYFPRLVNWVSVGALSACLAFIVFVPTLQNVNTEYQYYSVMGFVIAIPFLCMALYRFKEYEIRKEKESERLTTHIAAGVSGIIFMIAGFLMLLASINIIYMIVCLAVIPAVALVEALENKRLV